MRDHGHRTGLLLCLLTGCCAVVVLLLRLLLVVDVFRLFRSFVANNPVKQHTTSWKENQLNEEMCKCSLAYQRQENKKDSGKVADRNH